MSNSSCLLFYWSPQLRHRTDTLPIVGTFKVLSPVHINNKRIQHQVLCSNCVYLRLICSFPPPHNQLIWNKTKLLHNLTKQTRENFKFMNCIYWLECKTAIFRLNERNLDKCHKQTTPLGQFNKPSGRFNKANRFSPLRQHICWEMHQNECLQLNLS